MKEKGSKDSWRVAAKEAGGRLSDFLQSKLGALQSGKAIRRAINQKKCKINSQVEIIANTLLREGDFVSFSPPEKPLPKENGYKILIEDEFFFAVDKQPGTTCDESLTKDVRKSHPGAILLHRLDKETSGILLFAKTVKMQQEMVKLFKKQKVEKLYLAIVDGAFKKEMGKIENHLGDIGGSPGRILYGAVPEKEGKLAITHYKVLKRSSTASLLLCQPITGRTHQLRVHLNSAAHPILGDWQYGKNFRCQLEVKRHLLHAYKVQFIHPITGALIDIKSPPPADLKAAIHTLFPS